MVSLLYLINFILLLEITELRISKSGISEYKGKKYKVIKDDRQDPNLECEIPPREEEDLTNYRRKRMISLNGRVCLEDYPYTVSIRFNDKHICTGVLINYQYVLTVSDCVKDVADPERPVELSLRLGSPYREAGGHLLSVPEMFVHPKNGTGDYSHRIAMLKANVFITPTIHMMPVVLPFPRMKMPDFGHIVVTGYGNNNETGKFVEYEDQWLRRTFARLVDKEECLERWNWTEAGEVIDEEFHDDYMCVERYNETEDELYFCIGDMGVPLVHFSQGNFTPIIMGLSVTALEGCVNETLINGTDGKVKPGVFLKVPEYRGWIDTVLKNEAAKTEEEEKSSSSECELYPSFNENMRYLRRKKRLTTETALACLEDYPYTVSIRLHGMHWCGGAIISDDWVLTSAQCFDDTKKEDVTVRMGSVFRDYGGKIVSVTALVKHPQYKKGGNYPAHNLAMLQINMPIIPTVRVQIVKLIPPVTVRVGQWGGENVVTGYGSVTSTLLEEGVNQELRRMAVTRLPLSECQKAYEGITEVKQDQVCLKSLTEGVHLCTGDLGNPAVQFGKYSKDGTLFALAIFAGDDCNSSRPAIFTKIRPSRRWIDTVLREGPPPETEPPPTMAPVLRAAETSTSYIIYRTNYKEYLGKAMQYCLTHPHFQIDLRKVNLTATRRKRMTTPGKSGLTCLEDYPQTVAILKNDKEVICSGVIIAKQWVLTAAMCLEKCNVAYCHNLTTIDQLSIRMGSIFGSTGGRLVPVIDFRIHPWFNRDHWDKTYEYDNLYPPGNLAMLKFNIPYRPSPRMQRVLLPPYLNKHDGLEKLQHGRYIVSGFGGKRSGWPEDGFNDIHAIEVTPTEYKDCEKYLKNFKHWGPWFYQNQHICMTSKKPNITFCVGDIGMPLLRFDGENSKPMLQGISVYYPPIYNHRTGLCLPTYKDFTMPGVFVKVSMYVDWIKEILEEDMNNPQLFYRRQIPKGFPAIWYNVP